MPQKPRGKIVCYCNEVSQSAIEQAIRSGDCKSLDEIFDLTFAGVGACGGSCRPFLKKMLEQYQEFRSFPEDPRPSIKSKKK